MLARAVMAGFGPGRGLLMARPLDTNPLVYSPQYVLTDSEIDAPYRGAEVLFTTQGERGPVKRGTTK
jgi:hypothetical protein